MGRKRNRQWVKPADAWLSTECLSILPQFMFYMTLSGTVRHLLIGMFEPLGNSYWPPNWERETKLKEWPVGERLVRVPIRVHQNLWCAIDRKAVELGLSRSGLIRKAVTIAVDVRIEESNLRELQKNDT